MKKNGKLVNCGRSKTEENKKIKKGMCRPYKKITKDTPKTVKELGQKEVKRRLKLKMKNPNKKLSGGKKNSLKKKTNLKKTNLKKIGKTFYPQSEYSGKLYFKNDNLYFYDYNYHGKLTNIEHIISISELEKKIKEYKKSF